MDVKNAFLNGDLTEEVYMQPLLGSSVPFIKFEKKDLGLFSYFLGLEISHDPSGYFLTQAKYIYNLLARVGLTNCKAATTPVDPQTHLTPLDGHLLFDATLYRQLVGSLVYLTVTHPDIAYVVHIVNQFMVASRFLHYDALDYILHYLKGTMFHGLHYSAHSSLQLHAFSDADWAGDPTDHRSTIGFCFFLGDFLITWRSKKQTIVARSSIDAEYRALADTTQELVWLRWLLTDMRILHPAATTLYCDNQSLENYSVRYFGLLGSIEMIASLIAINRVRVNCVSL
ncbi:uncharacterized protein LOC114299782 [Camellia sinensis]|uniref:uncharacterized protein LOC114299782 n=1 Tax=Camellia sinensis TaxID=4442 RepID=UPI0010368D75|nr:uncharacterized protein LOC114299782 [Camellia sinensis]